MANKRTLINALEELITTQKATIEAIKSLQDDVIDLIEVLAETEVSPKITVQTSTAEEIKEALKPLEPTEELIMRAR